MNIRSKLSLTFILILIFGVTAVSSYSILFIRNYLLENGKKQIARDASQLSITLQFAPAESISIILEEFNQISGYHLEILNSADTSLFKNGQIKSSITVSYYAEDFSVPVYLDKESEVLFTYVHAGQHLGSSLVKMSQAEAKISEPITAIRYIIYSGMFISIALILLVSHSVAGSIAKPILQLKQSAQRIADGDTQKGLYVSRKDEFGDLADSLTKMAFKLREDTEQIQAMYNRHRQFYADITHEVRNPLHIINGSLEMILLSQGKSDPEFMKQHIKTAQRQVDRLNDLFNDLMMIQKYDDRELVIKEEAVSLDNLFDTIYTYYSEDAQQVGMDIVIIKTGLFVLADSVKLEQVLENLVKNAIKYSKGSKLILDAKRTAHKVDISVTDNGVGIDPEVQNKIFDRFFRADKSRSRQLGGSGLGLAIVKSILKLHQSDIILDNRPDKGCRFYFTLETA